MITIGRMAEKYGMLPHQVASQATTYDIMINDVLATYDQYEQQKSSGVANTDWYEEDDLQAMMEKARGKHN